MSRERHLAETVATEQALAALPRLAAAHGVDDEVTGLPVIQVAERVLTGVIDELWPQIRAEDARLFAESIVRLAISHITAPTSDPETTVKDIARLLGPFVAWVLDPG